MTLSLNDKFVKNYVTENDIENIKNEVYSAQDTLMNRSGAGNDFLGWLDLPVNYDKEEFARIKKAAEKIQKTCDILVVIGIGGSYLGARAAIEFVKSPVYNNLKKDTPDIYFAGNSISSSALADLLKICEGKDICVNVVSKSGTTTEPAVAFRIFRNLLEEKYGKDGAKERIFATTDKAKGTLKSFSDDEGYETFVVPDDVGGRFSVLTAVGLLPIAVAGIDIDAMMKGAADARTQYSVSNINNNDALKYVAIRNALYRSGKSTEILVSYEPAAQMLCEWWKQLFGESEGKDQKGIFPSSVIFSTDLHSLGQFIQDGSRVMFETVLNIKKSNDTIIIPDDPNNIDKLNFLSGKELDFVNEKAMLGTLFAHSDGNVPNIVIDVEDRSAYTFGNLVYFFEYACAVSGYTLGVNPFNQPGVESYKKNMFALLGKDGYEELRAELNKRMD
ncbi:MAG: glucose-6-phosphate isomerase [Ruminococcaceae bacterium]|nr:glucose-6-phosphate isomerase [Oscillospiraceae bacterium]